MMPAQSNGPSERSLSTIQNIRQMMDETRTSARNAISGVDDPKAQALLETTAEVLGGLIKAYQDYEGGKEEAWK